MAPRAPRSLLEVNVLLAASSLMTEEQRATQKRLTLLEQGRLMVRAMPKAMRMAELIAMWTIVKYREGAVGIERLAEFWGEPPRTMYRRLAEFRECWGIAGHDTPDKVADHLIAEYRRRKEELNEGDIGELLSAPVAVAGVPAL